MTGVELLIGGWFASPVIRSVIEKADKYLGANYNLHKDTEKLVQTFVRKLELCEATVTAIEKRPIINNSALANYMRRFKLVLYDAEDVLDNMEAVSIKEKNKGKNEVSEFASFFLSHLKNTLYPDDNLKSLKKVLDQLQELSAHITDLVNVATMNQNYESHNREFTHNQRETISQPLEEVLYGREAELNLILEMIFGVMEETVASKIIKPKTASSKKGKQKTGNKASSKKGKQKTDNKEDRKQNTNDGPLVISIDGMGGVGKTALAQAVFNNPEVQQAFATRAWVYVSYNLDVVLLMRKIIQSLGGNFRKSITTLEDTYHYLSSIIAEKRILVVLDDMPHKFSTEEWEKLYSSLSHGAPGSIILVTTSSHQFPNWVANRVSSFGRLTLSPLQSDKFWELFRSFAFADLEIPEGRKRCLDKIAKLIADKLDGLPLAAKVIGKLLNSNLHEDEWTNILKSNWWGSTEIRNQILPSIALNYEHLEPKLRQCFAYCSLFPKNSVIEKDRLIQMWMAQNFIPNDENGIRRPEDVGREWFKKLVDMFFFQHTWDNKSYVMPNFMHDLAIFVSSDECFYLSDESREIPRGIRHIAIETKNPEIVTKIKKCIHLRSFLFFGFSGEGMYDAINQTLKESESIRVLNLSYLNMENKSEPPPNIQNLTHLRFLDLSFTGINVLTQTSFHHYHLQALHIQGCNLDTWPRDINKLVNLRHLNANSNTIARISGIGRLTKLQELEEYRVSEEKGHKITELKTLRDITGQLLIKSCENITSINEAKEKKLIDKPYLNSIELCWSSVSRESNIDTEILEGLKPHKNIKELTLTKYLGPSFPDSVMQKCRNLRKFHLNSCIYLETLPPLGELSFLKYLNLDNCSVERIDDRFYGNSNQRVFPLLTDFSFNSQPFCELWTEATQVQEFFPCLSKLQINNNEFLSDVPLDCFSASLRVLEISMCPLRSLDKYPNSPTCLISLKITGVRVQISLNIQNLRFLEALILERCRELSIQGYLHCLRNLKRLKIIGCHQLLGNNMEDIMSKEKGKGLELMHQLGEGLQSLSNLEMDNTLWESRVILGMLPGLRILTLRSIRGTKFREHQTLWFQELTTLRELNFVDCRFSDLPSNLVTLSSLQEMNLDSCEYLQSLPRGGMPPNLLKLTLSGYSWLTQQCKPFVGKDWQLISHIPLIHFDNITIIIRKFTSDEGELWKLKSALGEWQIIDEGNVGDIWPRY